MNTNFDLKLEVESLRQVEPPFRSLRPRQDITGKTQEPGRSKLADKVPTNRREEEGPGSLEVGLVHSRGVVGVTSDEPFGTRRDQQSHVSERWRPRPHTEVA